MKNLMTVFNLLLVLPKYLIFAKQKLKRFTLIYLLSFMLTPFSLQAVTLDPTSSCPGSGFTVASGLNTIDGNTVGDPNYYQLSLPSAGNLTITFTSTASGNKTSTFFIGTACDSDYMYEGSTALSHSYSFRQYTNNPVYLKISDTNSNESFIITINFVPTSEPIMGDVPDQTTSIGDPFSLAIADYVTATDGDLILSYTLSGALPAGLNFNTTTGLLNGTPTLDGDFPLTVYATDIDGNSNPVSFILTVTAHEPPIMENIPNQSVVYGDPFSLAIADYVTETNSDPIISYTLSEVPSGLDFNTTTGLLNGFPVQSGIFTLAAYATDVDGNSNTETFTLTVGDTAPYAVDDDANTSKNIAVAIDILANDGTTGIPDPTTVTITSNPNSGTVVVNSSTGEVTYTPDTDFSGTDSFTYTVNNSDGIPSNVAVVTIAINAPIANDDTADTPLNIAVDINVTNNDISADSTIDFTTVTIVSNPTAGTVDVNATTGMVTYTPETGFFGNDIFTYTVNDANGVTSNEATVTISVISEQSCHDNATLLLNATAYGDTASAINDNGITSNEEDIYKVYLDLDGILEINITNRGDEGLNFDFSKDCGSLFASTSFGIDNGDSATLPIVLESGWYYLGFTGEKSNAATKYKVTATLLDPNIGSYSGEIAGGDADIVNNFTSITDYNDGVHYITTKISGDDSTSITGVYIDDETGLAANYSDAGGNGLWFMIIPYWSDGTCSTIDEVVKDTNGVPLVMQITDGTPSVTASIQVPQKAMKDARFKITYLDLGAIYALTGDQCILQSATTGNLQGIGQCINSPAIHYEPNFGTPAYYRCIYGNGQPCLSSHHGYSCGPNDTDCPNYNPMYDNEYGCLMCTLGANQTCSSDNLSVRPETYNMNIDSSTPLLTSGRFYELDANATYIGGGTAPTDGYTITLNNTLEKNASFIFNPDLSTTTCPPAGPDSNFTIVFNNGIGNASIKYENVGDINITLVDGNWTTVDQKSPLECIPGSDSISSNPVGCLIKGTLQQRYIPDRFDINATLKDHGLDFTYLNDTHTDDSYNAMAALLDINISARSETGTITTHYINGCYAKDTNLTLNLGGTNITYPGSTAPLTQFLYYNPVEDDGSVDSGEGSDPLPAPVANTISINSLSIDNTTISFPDDAPDGNGTTHIEYKLNFDRKIHLEVNPFRVDLSDVNITDTDSVEGTVTLTDQNATYYYARSRASKFFYEDITESNVDTPIIIDIYCDLSPTACSATGIDTVLGTIDEKNWYISTDHTPSDGNITLMIGNPLIEGTGTPTINGVNNPTPTDIANWIDGIDTNVNIDTDGEEVPLTVPVEIVRESDTPTPSIYSNEWLIYNPDTDDILQQSPSPFYKVRFIGDSSWTGTGNTGDVVNINASKKKSKRMDW